MVFAVGLALFSLGAIGAGDIKILCCYSLIIDQKYWPLSLITIVFLGGITALGIFIIMKISDNDKNNGVPYGIPIVVTSLFFVHLSTFN
ncbi:prepilin peptidase CpaA [Enterovibrio nigricans DSM 22720]|uniref:Prepilin peptidase CpaA n=2 Tax=Enterovibrio nigricans TaxID=504469 RepID=A0A1T4VVG8_9GAMM|nr:prepilin peptidase CpaA [Enterovibrio nigricans DSM 22720]